MTPVNDAAVITGTAVVNLTETNVVLTTSGKLNLTDVDGAASFVAQSDVAGSKGYGVFTLNSNGKWSYKTNDALNKFVAGAVYTDTLAITSADGTASTITVNILGTNDAPVISVPKAQTFDEDKTYEFSAVKGNAITVDDVDSSELTTTVTASEGTLTVGNSTSGTVILKGTSSAINKALDGLIYTPLLNANGRKKLTVTTDDGAKALKFDGTSNFITLTPLSLSGDITLEAWVNASEPKRDGQRIFNLGNGQNSNNIVLAFKGTTGKLRLENLGSDNTLRSITAPDALSSGWHHLAVSVNGSGVATIYVDGKPVVTGEVGIVADVVRTINYVGKSNSADGFFMGQMRDIRVWDTARTIAQIQAQRGTKNASGPEDVYAKDLKVWIPVTDAGPGTGLDSGASAPATPQLQSSYPTFTVVEGIVQTITLNVTPVNDAPTITLQSKIEMIDENGSRVFSAENRNTITVADVDGDKLTTTLIVNKGSLSLGGGQLSKSVSFSGSAETINTAINGFLKYTPETDSSESATLTVITSDGKAQSTEAITLNVKAAPVATLSGAIRSARLFGSDTYAAFADIVIGNVNDKQRLTATITLDKYATLKVPSSFSYDQAKSTKSSAVWTATGTATQITAMLKLVYVGAAVENIISPGAEKPFNMQLTVVARNGGATFNGSASHIEAGDTPLINMGSVTNSSIDDATAGQPFSTFTLTDPNAIEGMVVTVTVENHSTAAGVSRGEFSNYVEQGFSKFVIGKNSIYTLNLPGGLAGGGVAASAQAAVRALSYKPTAGADTSGTSATLKMAVQATQGFTADNGVYPITTNVVSSMLTVISTNRAPELLLNSTGQRVNTGGGTVTPFTASVVSDTNRTQTITLKVALDGTLGNLNNAVSLGMTPGNAGLSNAYYIKAGLTPGAAQALLRRLSYTLTSKNPTSPVLTVTVTDSSGSAVSASTVSSLTLSPNSPLTFSGTPDSRGVDDNKTITVFSYITASDADSTQQFVADVVVNNTAKAYVSKTGKSNDWVFVGSEDSSDGKGVVAGRWRYTASTLADLNQHIDDLTLVPVNNRGPVNGTENVGLTLVGNDGMKSDTATTTVNIASVNDAPTFSGVNPAGISMQENQPARPFSAWQINDPDAKSISTTNGITTRTGQTMTVTIDVAQSDNGYFKNLNGFHSNRALNIGAASTLVMPSVTFGKDFTLEARVRVKNSTAYTKIFDLSVGDADSNLDLYFENSRLHFKVRQGTSGSPTTVDSNDTFTAEYAAKEHLYSVVVSGSTATLYVDGSVVGSNAAMSVSNTVQRRFNVGETHNLVDGSTRLEGTVRDVRLWVGSDRNAITGAQVLSGTDSTKIKPDSRGLSGWWTLDTPPSDTTTGAYGVVVSDSSLYYQSATISGQPDWLSPTQYTFAGSRPDAEAALQRLQWVPQNVTSRNARAQSTAAETTNFDLSVKDDLDAFSKATSTVTVTANDTVPGCVGSITSRRILETNRFVELFPALEITKSERDGVEQTVSATVSLSGFGMFTTVGLSVGDLDADGRAYHVSGTAAAVQAALANLRYDTVNNTASRFAAPVRSNSTVPITLTLRNQAGASVTRTFDLTIGSAALPASGVLGDTMDNDRVAYQVDFTLSNAQPGDKVEFDETVFKAYNFSHSSFVANDGSGKLTWTIKDNNVTDIYTGYGGGSASRIAAIEAATFVVLTQAAGTRVLSGNLYYNDRKLRPRNPRQSSSSFNGWIFSQRISPGTSVNLQPATTLPYNDVGMHASTLSASTVPFDSAIGKADSKGYNGLDSYGVVSLSINGWQQVAKSGYLSDADSLAFDGTQLTQYGTYALSNGDQYLGGAIPAVYSATTPSKLISPAFSVESRSNNGSFTFRAKSKNDYYTEYYGPRTTPIPPSPTKAQWETFIGKLVLKQPKYVNESRLLTWAVVQERLKTTQYRSTVYYYDNPYFTGASTSVAVEGGYTKQGNQAPTVVVDSSALALTDAGDVMPFTGTTVTDGSNPNETNSLLVSLAPGSVPGALVYTGAADSNPFKAKNGGWYIDSRTPAALQDALRLMKFVPTANTLAAGVPGQASFVVEVSGTADTGVFSGTIWSGGSVTNNTVKVRRSVTVTGANDAPWLTLGTTSLALNGDGDQTVLPFAAATLGDPDPEDTLTLVIQATLAGSSTVLGSFLPQAGVTISSNNNTATMVGTASVVQLAFKNLNYFVPANSAGVVSGNISFGLTLTDKKSAAAPVPPVFKLTRVSSWVSGPAISGLQSGTAVWNRGSATPFDQLVLTDTSSAATLNVTVAWATANGSVTINGRTYSSGSVLTFKATGTAKASEVAQVALRTLSFTPNAVLAQTASVQTIFTVVAASEGASASNTVASVVQYGDHQRVTLDGLPGDAVFSDKEGINPFLQTKLADPLGKSTSTVRLLTARVVLTDNATYGDFTSYAGFTRSPTTLQNGDGTSVSVVVYTARATASALQGLLQQLSYRGKLDAQQNRSAAAASATSPMRLELDEGDGQVAMASFNLTNNLSDKIPQLALVTASLEVSEGTATNPFSGLTVIDDDAASKQQAITVYVKLVGVTQKYARSKASGLSGFIEDGDATRAADSTAHPAVVFTRTFQGATAAADARAALQTFSFTPDKYHATPGKSSSSEFSVWVNDGVYTSATVSTAVKATAINTAIALSGGSVSLRTVDGRSFAPFSSLEVIDPDVGDLITATISLTDPTAGVLSNLGHYFAISDIKKDTKGNATGYTITGMAATVAAALRSVTFIPTKAPVGDKRSATLNLQISDAANTTAVAATNITINSAEAYLMPDVVLKSNYGVLHKYDNANQPRVYQVKSKGLLSLKVAVRFAGGSRGAWAKFSAPVIVDGVIKISSPVRDANGDYYWDFSGSSDSQGKWPTLAEVQNYLRAATVQGAPNVQASFKPTIISAVETVTAYYGNEAGSYTLDKDLELVNEANQTVTGVPSTSSELVLNPMIRWPLSDLVVTTQAGDGEKNDGVTGLGISYSKTSGGSSASNVGLIWPSDLSVNGVTVIEKPVLSGGRFSWKLDGSADSQGVRPTTAQLQTYLRGVRIENYSNDDATYAVKFTEFRELINDATRSADPSTLDSAFANERAVTFVPGVALGGNRSEIAIYNNDGTSGITAVDNSNITGERVLAFVEILERDLTASENVTVTLSDPTAGTFSAVSLGSETDPAGYFTDAGSGVYTYSGSAANANIAIQRLSFVASANVAKGATKTTLVTVTAQRGTSEATPVSVTVVAANQSAVFLPDAALTQKNADVPTFILMDVLQLRPFAKSALLETVTGDNVITVNVVVSDSTAGTLGSPAGTKEGQGFEVSTDQKGLEGNQKRYTYTQPKASSGKSFAYSVLGDAVFTPNQRVAGADNKPKPVTLSVSATVDGIASLVNTDTSFLVQATAQTLSFEPSFTGSAEKIYVRIIDGQVGDYVVISTNEKYNGFIVKQINFREWLITPPNTSGANNTLVTDLLKSLTFVNNASSDVPRTFKASVVTTDNASFESTKTLTVVLPTVAATPALQAVVLPAWVNTPYAAPDATLGTDVNKLKAFKSALATGMIAVRLSSLCLNFSKQTNLLGYLGAADYLKIVGQNLAFEKSNKLSDWTEGYAPDPHKPWRVSSLYYVEGLANHIMYTPYFEVFNNMGAHRAGSVRSKIVIGAYLTDAINNANGTDNEWTDRFGRAESDLTKPGDVGKHWKLETVDDVKYYFLYGTPRGSTDVQKLSSSDGVDIKMTEKQNLALKDMSVRQIAWRAEFVSLDYNGSPDKVRLIPYNMDRSLWHSKDPEDVRKYKKYVYRDFMSDGISVPTLANGGVSVLQPDGTTRIENPLFQNAKMAEKQSRLIYATNILSFVGVGVMFSFFALSVVQMKMQGKSDGEIVLLLTESGLAGVVGGPFVKGVIQYSLLYAAAILADSAPPTFHLPGGGLFSTDLDNTYKWLKPLQGYTTTAVNANNLIRDTLAPISREGKYAINAGMRGRALLTTRAALSVSRSALLLSAAANPITEAAMFVATMFVGALVAAQSGDPKLVLAALEAQFYTHVQVDALAEFRSIGSQVSGAGSYMYGHSPGSVNADGSDAKVFQYAAGSNKAETLSANNANYSTMFITGMGLDQVFGSIGKVDSIVGGFSGIDDKTLGNDENLTVPLGRDDLATKHAVYDGGTGSSNVLSLQDMGSYVAGFTEETYAGMGGYRKNTVYTWLAVDVNLNTGTVWASGFSETDVADTAMGFDVAGSERTRVKKIFSGVEIKNIDIIMGNNLNVTFTAADNTVDKDSKAVEMTSSYFGGDGNSTAIGGTGTNKFVGGTGANVFFSGAGTNDFTTGLGLNDFNVGLGTEHIFLTSDAGDTVIRYVNIENLSTDSQDPRRPDATDDDELWFPIGVTPMDLAFFPVEGKSLGVSYDGSGAGAVSGSHGLILDGFFKSYDQRIGMFVFNMPGGQVNKLSSWEVVNAAGLKS